jgi:glutathione S-transferase
MLKLYDLDRSGNCYKIRLFLSLIEQGYEKISINLNVNENESPEFLALNPRGQVPVIDDNGYILWDSTAILVYLASAYGEASWLPQEHYPHAQVMQWLALEQNEGRYGLARARAIGLKNTTAFARLGNQEECRDLGHQALAVLELRLSQADWLVGRQISIADIACYPYVALAPEGGIDLSKYRAVEVWMDRIKKLPNYIPLPKASS